MGEIVKVTRRTNRYRRTINGAWVGGGTEVETFEIDEDKLDFSFSINDGITVEYADGTTECCYPGQGYFYPLTFYPAQGRLSRKFQGGS